MSCDDSKRIVIVRGNDTNFNGQPFFTLNITSSIWDLSELKASLSVGGVTKQYNDLSSGTIDVSFTAAETATMPFGNLDGVLKFYNTENQVFTAESLLPFKVISIVHGNAIAVTPATYNITVEQGGETVLNIDVEASVSVEVGTTTTLPAGSDATVINSGTGSHLVLDFGIPRGEDGQDGKDGKDGADGKDGKDGEDGKDGTDGRDATINGENTLTLTASNGLSLTQTGDVADISGKALSDAIGDIQELIPAQASDTNQLADKNFVNSTVQTGTANFRGNWADWATVPTNANDYPVDYAGNKTPTVNDYLVVQDASDYTGETLEGTWRFKYSGEWSVNGKSGWLPEYQVNETPLTAAQLAALNSGATATNIGQIATNTAAIGTLPSLTTTAKTDLVSAINEVDAEAGSKVSDVKLEGSSTSLVSGGVATIPYSKGATYGVVRTGTKGVGTTSSGDLQIIPASTTQIDYRAGNTYAPITCSNFDYILSKSIVSNTQTLAQAGKTAACDWIGAIEQGYADNDLMANEFYEVPQNVKLELSGGSLIVKAGTKYYRPDGVVAEKTTDGTLSGSSVNGQFFVCVNSNGGAARFWKDITFAGPTAPTGFSGNGLWYDTTNNIIKNSTDGGSTWANNFSFPIAIATCSGGSFISIDWLFNGIGFIASRLFMLPDVKGYIPNGRNADGSLNVTKFSTSAITVADASSLSGSTYLFSAAANYLNFFPTGVKYDREDNLNKNASGVAQSQMIGGVVSLTNGVIDSITVNAGGLNANDITTALGYTPVSVVQFNGTSVTTGGVANIPIATQAQVQAKSATGNPLTPSNIDDIGGSVSRSVYDNVQAITAGAINLADGSVFYTTSPTANTAYTISTSALTQTGFSYRYFNVILTQPSVPVACDFTTNNNVKWVENTTPDLSVGDRTYLLAFQTFDGGTNWVGSLATWWE